MNVPAVVEPLITDQAWTWGGYCVRKTIQMRPADLSLAYACMESTGAREAAFFRWVFQRGLEVVIMEKMENVCP